MSGAKLASGAQVAWMQAGGTSRGNDALTELYIGDFTELLEIGEYAFAWSHYLKNIRLNNFLTSIRDYAFYECTSLKTADLRNCTSLNYVYYHAFGGCTALEKIILPKNLISIAIQTFEGSTRLGKIVSMNYDPPRIFGGGGTFSQGSRRRTSKYASRRNLF